MLYRLEPIFWRSNLFFGQILIMFENDERGIDKLYIFNLFKYSTRLHDLLMGQVHYLIIFFSKSKFLCDYFDHTKSYSRVCDEITLSIFTKI